MATGGFSTARLARMHDTLAGYVERGEVPGIVTLVSRRGETHVDVFGTMSDGGDAPMRRDTIFRISSMTKPITAVAAMILAEECRLRLDDPVDSLLPELANRRVLARLDGPIDDTVPANRPITDIGIVSGALRRTLPGAAARSTAPAEMQKYATTLASSHTT